MVTDRRLLELQASLCRVLANTKRLEILYALEHGERSAGELARAVETTPANLSQHLALMRQHGLVEARREGLNVYYRLTSPVILDACRAVREALVQNLERQRSLLEQERLGTENLGG
ncbi:ArsR/SmtB family transcription factor [Caldinitratiruptor microaerophilus]|uniref:Transcriptional regulator n=1 Tax=Caldinitratiruptor microaerophilus TaxID=671077 RepID=A0AA35CHR1_9FIRM|nr:metalloregulator ArsR/SmtB family transcription factor [Caldinitratiruptor microaerophilus]BDG59102.1 transcriptional regulator [Caldinitratiruptor microaerophilus]